MNKPAQDKDNFEFTKRWVEQHLPFGLEQTTDVLYNDFFKALFESDLKYSPSIEMFRSQLRKIDCISSRWVVVERNKEMVRMKEWYKVEKLEDILDALPVEPCIFSKHYDKSMKLLAAGKEKLTWWK